MNSIFLENNQENDEEITDLEEKSNGESEEEGEIDQSDHEANKISDEDSSFESQDEQIKKLLSGKINNIQINDIKKMLI